MEGKNLYLTPEGAEKLRAELKELTGPRRKALAERLHHAVRQGDLSENADYIAAKEEQAFLEGRILELETVLREALIVEGDGPADRVDLGCRVRVTEDGGEPEVFQLVGQRATSGKISRVPTAPHGKRAGETAVAQTPAGDRFASWHPPGIGELPKPEASKKLNHSSSLTPPAVDRHPSKKLGRQRLLRRSGRRWR
jgi:transcription elongation factor GreA